MSSENPEFWKKAHLARNKLVDQFLNHPEVSLIDIGYDPNVKAQEKPDQIVLRVHVRSTSTIEGLYIPSEIDGIPVRVVIANYKLE